MPEPKENAGEEMNEATRIMFQRLGGLNDVRLHDLRHSYASLAANRGVSLQMIGKLLGHKLHAWADWFPFQKPIPEDGSGPPTTIQ